MKGNCRVRAACLRPQQHTYPLQNMRASQATFKRLEQAAFKYHHALACSCFSLYFIAFVVNWLIVQQSLIYRSAIYCA